MAKAETLEMAAGLMEAAAAFAGSPQDFLDNQGGQIIALARAIAADAVQDRPLIQSWSALKDYVSLQGVGMGREAFRVIFLDKKNRLIADEVMGVGTVDHAPVYPREVARRALELDAVAIILTHNHPSGDPSPSSADIEMTRQIVDALRALRIAVHDHLITSSSGAVASFKALGLI